MCLPQEDGFELTEVVDNDQGAFEDGSFEIGFKFSKKIQPSDNVLKCLEEFKVSARETASIVLSKNNDRISVAMKSDLSQLTVEKALIDPWVVNDALATAQLEDHLDEVYFHSI